MNKDFFLGNGDSVEKISAPGVFEGHVTGWIAEFKNGSLTADDLPRIMEISDKVAKKRGTPGLIDEIRSRLGLS